MAKTIRSACRNKHEERWDEFEVAFNPEASARKRRVDLKASARKHCVDLKALEKLEKQCVIASMNNDFEKRACIMNQIARIKGEEAPYDSEWFYDL